MAKLSSVKSQQGVRLVETKGRRTSAREQLGELEVALAGKLAVHLNDNGGIRMDLVERVRKEIAEGTFETPERIDATVDRLLDELYPE